MMNVHMKQVGYTVWVLMFLCSGNVLFADEDLPFRGGISGGHAHQRTVTTTCAVASSVNLFAGGLSNGFAHGRRTAVSCNVASGYNFFAGGTGSGTSHAADVRSACLVESVYSVYAGGSSDGFSHRKRIYHNCFGPNSTIESFDPTAVCQGESITITGTYFSNVDMVTFSNNVHTDNFSIIDSSSIEAIVPPGAVSGPVEVSGPEGTAVSSTILTVSPLPIADFTYAQSGGLTFGFTSTGSDATGYFWEFEDGSTSTAASTAHTFPADGTYPVLHIASNDCGSDTLLMEVEIRTVGIAFPRQIEMSIRPNPFREQFYLTLNAAGALQLQVFNMLGQAVYSKSLQATDSITHTVEMAGLPPGIYMVQVNGHGTSVNRRVVKGE